LVFLICAGGAVSFPFWPGLKIQQALWEDAGFYGGVIALSTAGASEAGGNAGFERNWYLGATFARPRLNQGME
jgi:hypothetical protein